MPSPVVPEGSFTQTSKPSYPTVLAARERDAVGKRRAAAGLPPNEGHNLVGLALSGGGIRSATFSLGVLSALARHRLLRHVDFLSTVSGGGYIGSFLGRLWEREEADLRKAFPREAPEGDRTRPMVTGLSRADLVERVLAEPRAKPVAFLRENGRYLSPNGSGDLLVAGAVALRNWAAIHVVLATFFVTLFLALFLLKLGLRALLALPPVRPGLLPLSPPWSDLVLLPAALLPLLVVPVGWAYWLAQRKGRGELLAPALGGWLVLGASALLLALRAGDALAFGDGSARFLGAVAAISALALLAGTLAGNLPGRGGPRGTPDGERSDRDRMRNNRLARWLASALLLTAATLGIALLDTLGAALYEGLRRGLREPDLFRSALSASGLAALVAAARKLVSVVAGGKKTGRKLPVELLAGAAAFLLTVLILSFHSAIACGFAANWGPLAQALESPYLPGILAGLAAGILFTAIFGKTVGFLNQSSLQALYTARLARAYLGASNPKRWTDEGFRVTDPIEGDGIGMEGYRPDRRGGPLHILNVTLNETISGKSNLEQRDRKGLALAVGPCAVTAGRHAHAERREAAGRPALVLAPLDASRDEYTIFTPPRGAAEILAEPLHLETWVSISGAAFTTGLGSRTSPGFSFLCGLLNVRLGYWWNAGVDPAARSSFRGRMKERTRLFFHGLLPVQAYLLDEFLARFRGPNAPLWYLSDGGHFENTAVYELIRRRLPLIVVCDNGADADYAFADLAALVRKARIDFQTEITFLDAAALEKLKSPDLLAFFGPRESLVRPGRAGLSEKRAALATIAYPGGATGLLVVLKPALTPDNPLDLIEYHAGHPDFPQESTADQFFDEAQWESYRKLGEEAGDGLGRLLSPALPAWQAGGPAPVHPLFFTSDPSGGTP